MAGLNGEKYHQIPDDMMCLGIKKNLKPSSRMAYDCILYKVQRYSKVSLMVTLEEFRNWGGLDERSVRTARTELVQKRLVTAERRPHGYIYSILSPSTGLPWTNSITDAGKSLDFAKLTVEQTEAYYRHRLNSIGEQDGNGIRCKCPFHVGDGSTLSITLKKGSAWKCFSCGRKGGIIDFEVELGLLADEDVSRSEAHQRVMTVMRHTGVIDATTGQLEALYRYEDANGHLLFEKVRYPGKDFRFRRQDPSDPTKYVYNLSGVRRVLYRLSEILRCNIVIVVEGEKDANRVSRLFHGDVAVTTAPFGAAQWTPEFSETLRHKNVVIIPDNDEAGELYCRTVCKALDGIASAVIVRNLPAGFKDCSEMLNVHPSSSDFIGFLNCDWIDKPIEI